MSDTPRSRRDLSMVNFGLVLSGRREATIYKPEWFVTPYDKGIEILQRRGSCVEDVAKVINPDYINDAHEAVSQWNGIGEEISWEKTLATAFHNEEMGRKLEKVGGKLRNNEDVDLLSVYGEIGSAVSNSSFGLTKASDVDFSSYKPFMKSGDPVIDRILGGIPTDGPIIVYGVTGVGKSHYAASKVDYFLHEHKNASAGIYTLEMSAEHYLSRETKMYPSIKEVMERLYVSGSVRNIEELVAEVTAKKLDLVVLDDMDNIVKSSEPSEYERVYRRVKEVCRFLKIPFLVLCQPNREAKWAVERGERFLGRYDIAWSGGGENSAALQVALQKANGLDMDAETFPTRDDEMFYEIFWKSRDGWAADYNNKGQAGPGAIVREKSNQMWRGQVYNNNYRLWQPESGSKSIKKKSKKD